MKDEEDKDVAFLINSFLGPSHLAHFFGNYAAQIGTNQEDAMLITGLILLLP